MFLHTQNHFNITFEYVFIMIFLQVEVKIVAKPYDRKFAAENEPFNETYINDTDIGEYQFTNLLPSTQYEMKVFAHNAGGGKGVGGVVTRFTDMVSVDGKRRRLQLLYNVLGIT